MEYSDDTPIEARLKSDKRCPDCNGTMEIVDLNTRRPDGFRRKCLRCGKVSDVIRFSGEGR